MNSANIKGDVVLCVLLKGITCRLSFYGTGPEWGKQSAVQLPRCTVDIFFFPLIRSSAAPGFFCNVPVSWLKNASKTPNENMRCGRLSDLWTVFWAFWSWFLLYRCNRSANQVLHSCGLLFPTFFTSGVFGQQEMSSYSCWLGENVWHPGWCGWSVQPNNKQLTEKERITRHNFYTSSSMSH